VFDEIKTGFRVAPGGYQETCGITPDLATYGKALANGFPLAAVAGQAALMEAARRTWISSTLASEASSLAAALAVLDWHEEADICGTLAETGRELRAAIDRAIEASGVAGASTEGIDPMFFVRWDDTAREARFVRECARAGLILKRGAYDFAAVAHDEEAIREVESAVSGALVAMVESEQGR
jgi:glutamate-1-semialdehyde aminotransferase